MAQQSGVVRELVSAGLVVESSPTDELPPLEAGGIWLSHPRLPFVSYSYEWPFAMLQDAALAQLSVLEALLAHGLVLRDGNPDNTVFDGPRPVFVDIGSLGLYDERDGWPGYDQFLRRAFYPLLLTARTGIPFQPLLRGLGPVGVSTATASSALRWQGWRSAAILRHVVLKHAADRRSARSASKRDLRVPSSAVTNMVRVLSRDVASVRLPRTDSAWSDYDRGGSYDSVSLEHKERVVSEWLVRSAPIGHVWDLGCNDGLFSLRVAKLAAHVLAVDGDPQVVESLYRKVRADGIRNVSCAVVDLRHPSPGGGWASREYLSLEQRGPADLLLALALWHHLILGGQIPPELVLEWFSRLGRICLLEFVGPEDRRASELASRLGTGHHELPTREAFERIVPQWFRVGECVQVAAHRVLYLLRSRNGH